MFSEYTSADNRNHPTTSLARFASYKYILLLGQNTFLCYLCLSTLVDEGPEPTGGIDCGPEPTGGTDCQSDSFHILSYL